MKIMTQKSEITFKSKLLDALARRVTGDLCWSNASAAVHRNAGGSGLPVGGHLARPTLHAGVVRVQGNEIHRRRHLC